MMAKREEELKEIRAKTTEEIQEEIIDLKGELFMLRLQKSAREEFKNSEFSRMRKREVLRLSKRYLNEGLSKRRKFERKWSSGILWIICSSNMIRLIFEAFIFP
ncbi:hypothetical protein ACHQM5_005491 [Ranunculus cassubicifolius]